MAKLPMCTVHDGQPLHISKYFDSTVIVIYPYNFYTDILDIVYAHNDRHMNRPLSEIHMVKKFKSPYFGCSNLIAQLIYGVGKFD